MVTAAGKRLSTRAIHRVITEGLLLAGVKKPGIVVHGLRHSTTMFALLNDANPTRVQKMMRHQHYATTEIYLKKCNGYSKERKMRSRKYNGTWNGFVSPHLTS